MLHYDRKYLNKSERERFIHAINNESAADIRLFCRILFDTGCRISECLETTIANFDLDSGYIYIRCLKKRKNNVFRRIPLSPQLLEEIQHWLHFHAIEKETQPLWNWSRMTAYRHVCRVMKMAGIASKLASPRTLRHTFAVNALEVGVPMNLVQRWLGHADWKTTAIYTNLVETEEYSFAQRIWPEKSSLKEHKKKNFLEASI